MKNLKFILVSSFFAVKALASPDSLDSRLHGGWQLKDFVIISSNGQEADFCEGAKGLIVYENSGHMSVSINCQKAKTQHSEPADEYGRMLFYAGEFKINGDEVAHKITNSTSAELIGKTLVRRVARLTETNLVLTGALGTNGQTLRIEWTRHADRAKPEEESLAYLTYLKLKPGTEKSFLAEVKKIVSFSRSEAGNIAWFVQQSVDDPSQIVFYTRWVNQAAIEWHLKAPPLAQYIEKTSRLLAEPAKLVRFRPLDIKQ